MVALIQSASNTGTGSTITATLGAGTTAANCLVTASIASGGTNPTVTGITLGGAADHFAHLVSAGDTSTSAGLVETWGDPNCAGSQTSVVVTFSAASSSGGAFWVDEFSGLASSSILDQSASAFTTSTQSTFSSGTTPTTTQASELWYGAVGGFNTTITGPSAPWTNGSQLTSGSKDLVRGYQIVSSTGTATYSGTYSPNSFEEASVVTLFTPSASVSGTVQPRATVPVPRRRLARAAWRAITGQAYVAVPAPRQEYQLAPRRKLARAVWRGGAGQAYVFVPAPVQQFRTAPRRKLARAYVQFVPVTTTNAAAVQGPAGTVPALMTNQARIIVRRDGRVVRR